MLLRGNVGASNAYERGVTALMVLLSGSAVVVDKLATFGLFLYFGAFLVGWWVLFSCGPSRFEMVGPQVGFLVALSCIVLCFFGGQSLSLSIYFLLCSARRRGATAPKG
jgi:hypothetical protein